jgi:signal transduction histidine kinase
MLRAVIENMPASILILAPDDSLTPLYANAACLQVNDVRDLEELKAHLAAQLKVNPTLQQFVTERVPAVLQGKSMVYSSTMTNQTTGAVTPVQRVLFPIYDLAGRRIEAVGSIAVDVRNIANRTERLEGELANKAALVEAVQHMYGTEKRRADHLSTVQQISTDASTLFDVDEMLKYFARAIRKAFGYYLVTIYTVAEEKRELELRAMDGDGDGPDMTGDRFPINAQSLTGWVASFGTEMEAEDTSKDLQGAPVAGWDETRSQFLVPISHSQTVLGVLCLQRTTPGHLDDIEKTAVRILADRIAVNIENARLFQQTREHGVLAERNRLAREIHDSLAQRLSEIHWQMRGLEQKLSESTVSQEDRQAVSSVADLAQESLAEARRSVWDLTMRELERHTLPEAIEAVVEKAGEDKKLKTFFDAADFDGYFLPGIESALLRICQEAVNNTVAHAEASELRVTLHSSPTQVELTVQDNGKGFNPDIVAGPSRTHGYGLTSIRERVRLAGGTVTIKSRPGGGTTVATVIPVPAKKQPR